MPQLEESPTVTTAERRGSNFPKLNLGCDDRLMEGYENVDIDTGVNAECLPYHDGTFDEVYASHVLEHISHRKSEATIKEWVRVLKPGGVLKIAVPSFEWCIKAYQEQRQAPLHLFMMGGHMDEHDYHKAIFDDAGLRTLMEKAGLWSIEPWKSEHVDCASLECSLNLMGWKPVNTAVGSRVKAAMTMPRLCMTDNMYCALGVCTRLGIEFQKTGGAYYDQNMERAIEFQMVGSEYVLAVDYDTIFNEEAVMKLVVLMDRDPKAGAIAATQIKRGCDAPLINKPDHISLEDHFADAFEVKSVHFGLTLIRVEALKAMKKPWFHHQPAPDGTWGDGRVDADVKFWHNMREAGWKVMATPRVHVGHAQLMITWLDETWSPVYQHIDDYWKNGKPKNVR